MKKEFQAYNEEKDVWDTLLIDEEDVLRINNKELLKKPREYRIDGYSDRITRIGRLQHRFECPTNKFHILTHGELRELHNYPRPLAEYMKDRGDRTMMIAIARETQKLADIMRNRGMEV